MDGTQSQGDQSTAGRRNAQDYSGDEIKCRPVSTDDLPGEEQPLQRLLKKLEEKLADYDETEATKKFADELKAFDKENKGLGAIVKSYEAFYDKLDCLLAEANNWKKSLGEWCEGETDEKTRAEIVRIWNEYYENVENEACKEWIAARDKYGVTLDCLKQSERRADEAKETFETVKIFEKSVKDRFTELKTLFDQGKAFNEKGEYTSVCAVDLEFCAAYNDLGVIETWEYRRRCGAPAETGSARGRASAEQTYPGPGSPCDAPEQYPLKTHRKPEQFRKELVSSLRAFILAKFDHFSRWQERIELEGEPKEKKDILDKIKKDRRQEFLSEVEQIPTEVANA
jgi:hypothetical protein